MSVKTILFDINQTVLDISALTPLFDSMYGGKTSISHWFVSLLHSSTVASLTGVKITFSDLAENALNALAIQYKIPEAQFRIEEILAGLNALPPHQDIIPALQTLQLHQFKTIAFSNSSIKLLDNQITNAGLTAYFDDIISVELSRAFKPGPAAYNFAAKTLGSPIETMRLVSAHDWDTHGAISAGMQAAYLARSKKPYNPAYKKPPLTGSSMTEIAEKLVSSEV